MRWLSPSKSCRRGRSLGCDIRIRGKSRGHKSAVGKGYDQPGRLPSAEHCSGRIGPRKQKGNWTDKLSICLLDHCLARIAGWVETYHPHLRVSCVHVCMCECLCWRCHVCNLGSRAWRGCHYKAQVYRSLRAIRRCECV